MLLLEFLFDETDMILPLPFVSWSHISDDEVEGLILGIKKRQKGRYCLDPRRLWSCHTSHELTTSGLLSDKYLTCLNHHYLGVFTISLYLTYFYIYIYIICIYIYHFSGGSVVKNLPANARDTGDADSLSGSGRSPGIRNDNPFQYSCLENPRQQTEEPCRL